MSDTLSADGQQTATVGLQGELLRLGWWGVVGLAGGALLLGMVWQWPAALQWLLQAALLWAFIYWQTHRRLPLNCPEPGAPLYADLGWANRLTLLRAWLIAAVGGFLFQPWPDGPLLSWLPGMIYFIAALLDRVDGYVARRTQHGSLLGNDLDMLSDALGLAVASLLAFGYGQVHWSYLLLGIAFYAFQGGVLWRQRQGLPLYPLPPSRHRRAWAGFQMGFLVVALWPLVYPPVTEVAGFAFMLPALIGFIVDWLVVSGRIDRQAERVDRRFRRLADFSQTVLQPTLRIVVVAILWLTLWRAGLPPDMGNPLGWANLVATGGFALTSLMLLLGIAGRYFSLLLLSLLGWYSMSNPMQPADALLLCGVIWLLLLGTGRFSLWLEDDHWLNRYDGA
ncbi:MAG: CDP-alcohol phosphatidyltransferase family protein [Pseudohongiellaceae bacterium]